MKKGHPEFYTSDGRINPDKAFGFVRERLTTMSDEEFLTILATPVQFRRQDGSLMDYPAATETTEEKPPKAKLVGIKKGTRATVAPKSSPRKRKVDS